MEKLKSSLTNMLVVLTVITIVAAGVLAYVNSVTAPQIEKINNDNLAAGIKAVMGSDEIVVSEPWEDDSFVIYAISDKAGNSLGNAVVTTENGFGGPLKVLVGFNKDGDILGYTVLEHAETPGLGAKANEWFQKGEKGDIVGMNPGKTNFTVSKDGGDVDAITASTITSRAFLKAIKNAYEKVITGVDVASGASRQEKENCGKGKEGGCCKAKEGGCNKAKEGGCCGSGKCKKEVTASDFGTPEPLD